jgi:hypothetical protein
VSEIHKNVDFVLNELTALDLQQDSKCSTENASALCAGADVEVMTAQVPMPANICIAPAAVRAAKDRDFLRRSFEVSTNIH